MSTPTLNRSTGARAPSAHPPLHPLVKAACWAVLAVSALIVAVVIVVFVGLVRWSDGEPPSSGSTDRPERSPSEFCVQRPMNPLCAG